MWPRCYRLLKAIPANRLFHDRLNARHPAGAFSISIVELPPRFTSVIGHLDELSKKPFAPGAKLQIDVDNLLDEHKQLIYALNEHLDDYATIARSFFVDEASAKTNASYRKFGARMKALGDPINRRANCMKHHQGRLGFCQVTSAMGIVNAYSANRIIRANTLGPDRDIHRERPYATSFNFDLRRYFVFIYAASEFLFSLTEELFPDIVNGASEADATCPWAANLAEKIAALPPLILPHEYAPPSPVVDIEKVRGSGEIMLRVQNLPQSAPNLLPVRPAQVTTTFVGDGVTTSFDVP